MNILIVEDDDNKRTLLREYVATRCPTAEVAVERSYRSGLKAIIDTAPQLVLLDMSMPTFDVTPKDKGGRTRAYAGRDVLDELKRKRVTTSVIVVTQYETFGEGKDEKSLEQLNSELVEDFPQTYLGAVYYHPAQSRWKGDLAAIIESHFEEGRSE